MILSKNHKFTKKEREAINSLLCDLDELDNKPRWLFSALGSFAKVFFEGDTHYKAKDKHADMLISIKEAETDYYLGRVIKSDILLNIERSINGILREEAKKAYLDGKEYVAYRDKDLLNRLASKIVESVFHS